jgi:hypothetical protein
MAHKRVAENRSVFRSETSTLENMGLPSLMGPKILSENVHYIGHSLRKQSLYV